MLKIYGFKYLFLFLKESRKERFKSEVIERRCMFFHLALMKEVDGLGDFQGGQSMSDKKNG